MLLTLSGGLHLALRRSKVQGAVVQAFDWDQTACQVYAANHGPGIAQMVNHALHLLLNLVLMGAGLIG